MKNRLILAGATPALALTLAVSSVLPASAQTNPNATLALQYLSRNQLADGSIPGFSPAGETEDFVIGATANNYDPRTLAAKPGGKSALDYLAAQASAGTVLNDSSGKTKPAAVAKMIMAVVDGKMNPKSFGNPTPVDLLAKLQATYQAGTGSFGSAAPAFDQALAILALEAAADPSYPVPANAVSYLNSLQYSNGGWGYGSSDTNSTAMTLMALAAAGSTAAQAKARTYLHSEQAAMNNGGFSYDSTANYPGSPPPASDPDSDGLVIQAIIAIGDDPAGATWTVNGKTAIDDLLGFQDSNSSDPNYGGFSAARPTASNPPDPFTSSQPPAALARVAYPVRPTYTSGASYAGATYAAAVVSTSPSASPIASSSPTPSPILSDAAPALPRAGAAPPPGRQDGRCVWVALLVIGIAGLGRAGWLLVARRA